MDVVLNGHSCTIPESSSVRDVVRAQSAELAHVAVAVNDHVVPRSQHGEMRLQPGDRIEIVHAVGGG